MPRKARTKLPKQIQKKVDEWKFTSGALMLCMVAYREGDELRTFQWVFLFLLSKLLLRGFTG